MHVCIYMCMCVCVCIYIYMIWNYDASDFIYLEYCIVIDESE